MKSKRTIYRLVFTFILLCLVGCTNLATDLAMLSNNIDKGAAKIMPFYEFNKTLLRSIKVESTANSNDNLPVALDMVFIFDDKTAAVLSKLSGPDWFANKQALLLQYKQQLALAQLEVVPQTAEQEVPLPNGYFKAVHVFLYANYLASAGQYQADITKFHDLKITLQKQGYSLQDTCSEEGIL